VAAWHGSKALVVSRSAKLQGIAEQFDLPHLARLDSHAALEAALETAVRVPRERLREVREGARAMCESFFETCVGRKDPVAVSRAAGANRLPASSNPLPHESLRATIVAEIPRSLRAGEVAVVRCSVTNRGNASYISAPPNPVQLCYRWYDEGGNPRGAGTWIHTALPRALGPGETASAAMRVGAPPLPGSYTLAVTLLQENVAWFDDVDPASRACGEVTIDAAAGEPAATEPFFRLSLAERRDLTRRALETRTPLLVRWGRIHDNWQNDWAYRATLAAEWLTTARSVADLGCGGMTLEPYLLPSQTYVPVDIVARDDRTIILDLEKDDLSGIAADACVLLGVVSYLFDVPAVLVKLHAAFDRIVLSYHVCAVDEIDSRLENGWVNHFRYDELKALFQAARFTVVREAVIEDSEYLFELVPAG
jgi:hypothetical protein